MFTNRYFFHHHTRTELSPCRTISKELLCIRFISQILSLHHSAIHSLLALSREVKVSSVCFFPIVNLNGIRTLFLIRGLTDLHPGHLGCAPDSHLLWGGDLTLSKRQNHKGKSVILASMIINHIKSFQYIQSFLSYICTCETSWLSSPLCSISCSIAVWFLLVCTEEPNQRRRNLWWTTNYTICSSNNTSTWILNEWKMNV